MSNITKGNFVTAKLLFVLAIVIALLIIAITEKLPSILSHDVKWVTPFESVTTTEYDLGDGYTSTETTHSVTTVVGVKHADKGNFTTEQWNEILAGIENGDIVWED